MANDRKEIPDNATNINIPKGFPPPRKRLIIAVGSKSCNAAAARAPRDLCILSPMSETPQPTLPLPRSRGVFCNRTLNFRSLRAIGYDMDYTLVDYRVDEFERQVFEFARERFLDQGWPVEALVFDPGMVARGLVIDTQLGNVVKANRFGLVRRAQHGTRAAGVRRASGTRLRRHPGGPGGAPLGVPQHPVLPVRGLPLRPAGGPPGPGPAARGHGLPGPVPARCGRWWTPSTWRAGSRPRSSPTRTAAWCWTRRSRSPSWTSATPARSCCSSPTPTGTSRAAMMAYAFDPFLPEGTTWRDLFDLVIVGARKPEFFTAHAPFFEVVTERRPAAPGPGAAAARAAPTWAAARPRWSGTWASRATRSSTWATTCSATCT